MAGLYPIVPADAAGLWRDGAAVPLDMIPSPPRGGIFDRRDIVDKIKNHFENHLNRPNADAYNYPSFTLSGASGVGKTHIAIQYAQELYDSNEVHHVLWVQAETDMDLKQSFTKIAVDLELPDAVAHGNHIDNRVAVLKWLKNTGWVPGSFSASQKANLCAPKEPGGTVVSTWVGEVGYKFLQHLVANANLQVPPNPTGSPYLNAYRPPPNAPPHLTASPRRYLDGSLNPNMATHHANVYQPLVSHFAVPDRLRENPTALAILVDHCRHYGCKLQDILRGYSDIDPAWAWELSFSKLKDDPVSFSLLSTISICSPDSIPVKLFEYGLPYASIANMEGIDTLLSLGLIRRNRDEGFLSIHRLTQSHFRNFLKNLDAQALIGTATQLERAFPPRDPATPRLRMENCFLYTPHVIRLKEAWKREQLQNPGLGVCEQFCVLLLRCQWFLFEENELSELEDMCNVNLKVVSFCRRQGMEKIAEEYETETHLGQRYLRASGRLADSALVHFQKSYDICKANWARLEEMSWAEYNLGQAYLGNGDIKMALRWLEKSHETWERCEWARLQPQGRRPVQRNPKITASIGISYMYMRPERHREAEEHFSSALRSLRN
ncbi:hypothetical protein QBC34DRAFT_471173 [Podospora aff. communis PSN243]|uniref:DUF7779 domain-containing protein n=1 Tax=Podospora aff. communis PSN243 TaxID=3040156 RepID=A0AAV9H0I4_9PEZI|nr:hypothetical protein QBC34DRAFT_471173 [Podospora aff. communis PSN243]